MGRREAAEGPIARLRRGATCVARFATRLRRRGARPADEGMTLVEIMVVVMIIGLVVGSVSVVAFNQLAKAKIKNTRTIVANVESGVQLYMMENNDDCPKSLDDLHAEKILKKAPKDAWDQALLFKCPGEQNSDSFDVISKGPDKTEGTEDDITNFGSEDKEKGP